ncbi:MULTISPECIES: hypothetical protein [Streptomyces]|uniref:Uncharacterized protein n=2 Tax=Streptomyces TaxID=1883 RepID=O86649_STRCO|nr:MULTISPECIES: hypothetical protein [Streptomyces]MYU45250.1 hypothetical protein [Streptomyces sp. SID7813]WOY97766.1 hypothetical protein R2E43_10005 [Streptomyces violaceoruber]MDX2929707.1 hypothetical protein [Streptomyces sp. NRRL_B-16638]MDX3367140.1 hypothetical protein [Streptomyces sp. ME02-6987-2C]MDX3408064.1 hypothetical protein [Streptomyces sp. ME02-6977A]
MSFDEMWGQARNAAAARRHSSMQLNQLAPVDAGGGSSPSLHVDAGVLEERATKADTVRTNFKDADNKVMTATGRVELKGFKSDSALSTFQKRWRSQMQYMDDLLGKGVAGNLRTSAAEFRKEEDKRRRAAKRENDSDGKK